MSGQGSADSVGRTEEIFAALGDPQVREAVEKARAFVAEVKRLFE